MALLYHVHKDDRLSADFKPILNPIKAIAEVKTSENVCADSTTSTVLPDTIPTNKLKTVSAFS
jgi:hypothetical protein